MSIEIHIAIHNHVRFNPNNVDRYRYRDMQHCVEHALRNRRAMEKTPAAKKNRAEL